MFTLSVTCGIWQYVKVSIQINSKIKTYIYIKDNEVW